MKLEGVNEFFEKGDWVEYKPQFSGNKEPAIVLSVKAEFINGYQDDDFEFVGWNHILDWGGGYFGSAMFRELRPHRFYQHLLYV